MTKIREYKEGDNRKVVKLINKIISEIFNAGARNIKDLKNIKEEYFEKKGIFYIAEDNGKIIGTIAVKREKSNVARLKRMFVDEEYRNRKIGQRLFNKILKFCKSKGYKKIILSTYPQMRSAIEFYKKSGFKEYKRDKQIFFERIL